MAQRSHRRRGRPAAGWGRAAASELGRCRRVGVRSRLMTSVRRRWVDYGGEAMFRRRRRTKRRGNRPDGSRAHRGFDFAGCRVRRRAGRGSSTGGSELHVAPMVAGRSRVFRPIWPGRSSAGGLGKVEGWLGKALAEGIGRGWGVAGGFRPATRSARLGLSRRKEKGRKRALGEDKAAETWARHGRGMGER